jgi:hypothetical protein
MQHYWKEGVNMAYTLYGFEALLSQAPIRLFLPSHPYLASEPHLMYGTLG